MSFKKTRRSPETSNFTGEDVLGFRQREAASAIKLKNKGKLVAAVALSALTTPLAAARADDIAAEIRELKEQLEPLKARINSLNPKLPSKSTNGRKRKRRRDLSATPLRSRR
jgi:uncharacterized protein YlxW (UPF0749 family)